MNDTFHLLSIGFACQHLQLPIATIRATADRLGIRSCSINGVAHFSESDVERIREAIAADIRAAQPIIDQRSNIS